MSVLRILLVCAVLGLALAKPHESSDAHLLVLKSVDNYDAVVQQNLTITVNVFNVGKGPAFDVDVDDSEAWTQEGVSLVGGVRKVKVDKIPSGESRSNVYVVAPQLPGKLILGSTKVTYKNEPKADDSKTVHSNVMPELPVLTSAEYSRRTAKHYKEWFVFLILSGMLVGVPFYVYKTSLQKLKGDKA